MGAKTLGLFTFTNVVIDSSGSRIDVIVGGKVAFVIFHAPVEAIGAFFP